MGKILATVIAAIILMGIVVVCLAIGKILTGKSRLRRGSCGMVPREKGKKDDKTTSCSICGAKKICEEEDEKANDQKDSKN